MRRLEYILIVLALCGLAVNSIITSNDKTVHPPPASDHVRSTQYDIDLESHEGEIENGMFWWLPCASTGHLNVDLQGDYIVVVPHSP